MMALAPFLALKDSIHSKHLLAVSNNSLQCIDDSMYAFEFPEYLVSLNIFSCV